ncbi:GNAT family N-acetyltransferase [Bacillus cereus group sp. MYBK227-2]|uniref:GNAT family N-acetyltransferase n=1 Tax=Bacillus cereus group TaxID=86661 RepID=UPI000CD8928D|nr:GNAT family N-acetyltransferase [Bacillus thuringiensis]QFQ28697.1 GNAT family N-acetyltransferase [Bacillus thuringiensis]
MFSINNNPRKSKIRKVKLQVPGDVKYELHTTYNLLLNEGYQVLSVINIKNGGIIVYRHLYEDTNLYEENSIVLKIRLITNKGTVFPEPYLYAHYISARTTIDLADIFIEEPIRNLGLGSILMKHLLQIAVESQVDKVTGLMVSDDSQHKAKQINFYMKHGFEISGNHLLWKQST